MPRQFGIDLPDAIAKSLFDAHIPAAALHQASALFSYGKAGQEADLWKHAAKWADINRTRAFLEDVVDATRGRTLNQKSWRAQMDAWFASKDHSLKQKDILRAAFRCRCMVAHLRDAARDRKSPPSRYRQLTSLVQSMSIQDPEEAADEARAGNVYVADVPDCIENFDEECQMIDPVDPAPHEQIDVDSSQDSDYNFDNLVDTSQAHRSQPAPQEEATSATGLDSKCSIVLAGGAQPFDLQKLLVAAGRVPAIDPRTGDKNFKPQDADAVVDLEVADALGIPTAPAKVPMKRPAASTGLQSALETPLKKPAGTKKCSPKPASKCSPRHLLYSSTYHRERKRMLDTGAPPDQASKRAREVAQEAVAHL